jgi:4-aminobutyrate aminotransferase/(S)-3-amino-2-methylpropionate transaminase
LVVLTCGTFGNVLRFLPPLVMPDHLLEEGLDLVSEAFDRLAGPVTQRTATVSTH